MSIHLKLNLGGQGGAPIVPINWTNVWGLPYVDADLFADVDFGNIGSGIGLRCINDGSPNAWGENNQTAAHDLGTTTGGDTGVYPDNVLIHGWFTNARVGKIELYNHTATPLTGKTFTIRLLGSRKDLIVPRTSLYTVNGVSKTLDVDDNIDNLVEFNGVSSVGNIITITTTNTTPSDTTFAYLNAIEIVEEVERIHLKLNLGGWGTQPAAPAGWTNVWGVPVNTANLLQNIEFNDVGRGIGLRALNSGAPNHWGVNNNTGAHDLGKVTGTNAGIYPDDVLKHGWFTKDTTGKILLYNFSGTPLTGKTFTLRLLGSRKDLTQPRTSVYTVHGNTILQDVDDNMSNLAVFPGVTPISNQITIEVTNGIPSDLTYGYLSGLEIEEEEISPVRNVVSVQNPEDKTVRFGTPFEELENPPHVTAELDDQTIIDIDTEWQSATFNPQTPGSYPVSGTLSGLPAGITNTLNRTAASNVTVAAAAASINLKLNLGGRGTAPSVPNWKNVWGQPYIDADLTKDKDFGEVGFGIGLRCINDGAPNAWGENVNTAVHDLGKVTGTNAGVYPDNVLKHGWFTVSRIGTIELYNKVGTPLNSKTFTIRLLGSRRDLAAPRTSQYTVNGVTKLLDVDDNSEKYVDFPKVSAQNSIITIITTHGTPTDQPFAYLNAIEIIEEGSAGPLPSKLYFTIYNTKNVLVYLPPSYDSQIDYPVIFFYQGFGGKGSPLIITQNIATADGIGTSFTASFQTRGYQRVLYSSVIIKVNAEEVARGKANGTIWGSGVSGPMQHQTAGGRFTINFAEAPASGAVVSITYQRSEIFETGLTEMLNRGDEPPGVIILSPQIPSGVDYSEVPHFDELKVFANTLPLNIDTNRIYLTGLSLGARASRRFLLNRYTEIAAVIGCSLPDYTFTWANNSDIGTMWIHGTADPIADNKNYAILSGAGSLALNIYPRTKSIWGGKHTGAVWNTHCYDRLERTLVKGKADFDYVRWLKKHNKDLTQRATLFVEYVEYSNSKFLISNYHLIEDHREAFYHVNQLPAGITKTNLLTRLSKVKADKIDKGGKRYLIDLGVSAGTTATFNGSTYNNITNLATAQSIANILDEGGGASTIGFTVVTQSTTSPQQAAVQSNRGNLIFFGLARTANTDGCILGSTAGTYKFTGLNNLKKYRIRFHHNEGSIEANPNLYSARAEISVTIGAVTKTQYSGANGVKYVEFTNQSPSSGQIQFTAKRAFDRNVYMTIIEFFQEA